jgi:UDP:flavonoid glycosyltransferase YjiC (YdhE family)
MRVFVLTLGTRGDFELFCTLGRELRRRGHHVVLGTSGFYAQATEAAGLEWTLIGGGTQSELIAVLRSLGESGDRLRRVHLYASGWVRPQLHSARAQIARMSESSDYFISNLKMVLERDGAVLPGAFVSYDPPDAVENLARFGSADRGGRILEIVAMSRGLVDPEARWGAEFRFTGFWVAALREAWTPPARLVAFLDDGPPPVVMTLGSMVNFDAERLTQQFGSALAVAGQRGILIAGWAALSNSAERMLTLAEADYDWLFARAACVIHHGGVGTLAAVLRAGKPSILLPQILSQAQFGNMLMREKLAAGVFEASRIEPGELAAAIQRAVSDHVMSASALRWQAAVRAEGGVHAAADLIEQHAQHLAIPGARP